MKRRPEGRLERVEDRSAEQEFRRIYKENVSAIAHYAARRVDPDETADVVSEVFTTVWRRAEDWPEPDEIRLWIYGIARHTIRNRRRSQIRRSNLVGMLTSRESRRARQGWVDRTESETILIDAISQLPEHYQEVLFLRGWEELRSSEIAAVLGMSESAARKRLFRARKMLQEILDVEPGATVSGAPQ